MKRLFILTLAGIMLLASTAFGQAPLVLGNEPELMTEAEPTMAPPPIQGPWKRLEDPTGSRTQVTYHRRYLVSSDSETDGGKLKKTTFDANVVKKLLAVGANDVRIAFLANPASSHSSARRIPSRKDDDLNGTRPKGSLLPTDELELHAVRTYSTTHDTEDITLPGIVSFKKHTITETVTITVEGTVNSLDRAGIAYSVRPQTVTRTQVSEYSTNVRIMKQGKLLGFIPVNLLRLLKTHSVSSQEIPLTNETLGEAMTLVIPQLETSPSVRIPERPVTPIVIEDEKGSETRNVPNSGSSRTSHTSKPKDPELRVIGTDAGNERTVYLSSRYEVAVGMEVLIPVKSEERRSSHEYVSGKISKIGQSIVVTLNDTLKRGYKVNTSGRAYLA